MITVCIMSYRYAHLASQAIESVLCQTRRPDRILLVDDGAHDGIDKIGALYNIETIVRPDNLGIVENFNQTLNLVTTEKVMFLGADNWLRQDALEKMVTDADITSSDIVLFGTESSEFAETVGANKEDYQYIWRFKQGDINQGNYIHGSSVYNVKLAKKFGYERSNNLKSEEDWMLWRKMLNNGATHKHINEPLLFYRRHKQNYQK